MFKTAVICCRSDVCLFPSLVGGIVWVGFINLCVRSKAACVAASYEDILGNGGGLLGRNMWCRRLAP